MRSSASWRECSWQGISVGLRGVALGVLLDGSGHLATDDGLLRERALDDHAVRGVDDGLRRDECGLALGVRHGDTSFRRAVRESYVRECISTIIA